MNLKEYRDQNRDYYGDLGLDEVAKDVFYRAGLNREYGDGDAAMRQWAKDAGHLGDIKQDLDMRRKLKKRRQIQQEGQQNLEEMNPFTRGLAGGIQKTQGLLYGAAGMVGDATGWEGLQDWGLEGYERNMLEAARYPTDVQFADLAPGGEEADIGDFGEWVGYTLGDLAPSMAAGLVSGGVGSAVGGVATAGLRAAGKKLGTELMEKGFKNAVKKQMAKGIPFNVAKKAAERGLGAQLGVVAGMSPLEAGGMYGEATEKVGKEAANPYSAALLGLAAGAVEIVGGNMRIINKVLGKQAGEAAEAAVKLAKKDAKSRPAAMQVLSGILHEAARQVPGEMGQEAAQEALAIANMEWTDPDAQEALSTESAGRVLEAAAAGGLAGLAGAPAGVAAEHSPFRDNQTKIDKIEQDLQGRIERQERLITKDGREIAPGVKEKLKANKAELEKVRATKAEGEGRVSYEEAANTLDRKAPQPNGKKTKTSTVRKMAKSGKLDGNEYGITKKSLDARIKKVAGEKAMEDPTSGQDKTAKEKPKRKEQKAQQSGVVEEDSQAEFQGKNLVDAEDDAGMEDQFAVAEQQMQAEQQQQGQGSTEPVLPKPKVDTSQIESVEQADESMKWIEEEGKQVDPKSQPDEYQQLRADWLAVRQKKQELQGGQDATGTAEEISGDQGRLSGSGLPGERSAGERGQDIQQPEKTGPEAGEPTLFQEQIAPASSGEFDVFSAERREPTIAPPVDSQRVGRTVERVETEFGPERLTEIHSEIDAEADAFAAEEEAGGVGEADEVSQRIGEYAIDELDDMIFGVDATEEELQGTGTKKDGPRTRKLDSAGNAASELGKGLSELIKGVSKTSQSGHLGSYDALPQATREAVERVRRERTEHFERAKVHFRQAWEHVKDTVDFHAFVDELRNAIQSRVNLRLRNIEDRTKEGDRSRTEAERQDLSSLRAARKALVEFEYEMEQGRDSGAQWGLDEIDFATVDQETAQAARDKQKQEFADRVAKVSEVGRQEADDAWVYSQIRANDNFRKKALAKIREELSATHGKDVVAGKVNAINAEGSRSVGEDLLLDAVDSLNQLELDRNDEMDNQAYFARMEENRQQRPPREDMVAAGSRVKNKLKRRFELRLRLLDAVKDQPGRVHNVVDAANRAAAEIESNMEATFRQIPQQRTVTSKAYLEGLRQKYMKAQVRLRKLGSHKDQAQKARSVRKAKPYEVSTQGDRRFSAFNARLKDGRTIEEAYQVDVKGYKTKEAGKGKPPKNNLSRAETYAAYKGLWEQWADENPELMQELAEIAKSRLLTDKFATTEVNQARALTDILQERGMLPDDSLRDEGQSSVMLSEPVPSRNGEVESLKQYLRDLERFAQAVKSDPGRLLTEEEASNLRLRRNINAQEQTFKNKQANLVWSASQAMQRRMKDMGLDFMRDAQGNILKEGNVVRFRRARQSKDAKAVANELKTLQSEGYWGLSRFPYVVGFPEEFGGVAYTYIDNMAREGRAPFSPGGIVPGEEQRQRRIQRETGDMDVQTHQDSMLSVKTGQRAGDELASMRRNMNFNKAKVPDQKRQTLAKYIQDVARSQVQTFNLTEEEKAIEKFVRSEMEDYAKQFVVPAKEARELRERLREIQLYREAALNGLDDVNISLEDRINEDMAVFNAVLEDKQGSGTRPRTQAEKDFRSGKSSTPALDQLRDTLRKVFNFHNLSNVQLDPKPMLYVEMPGITRKSSDVSAQDGTVYKFPELPYFTLYDEAAADNGKWGDLWTIEAKDVGGERYVKETRPREDGTEEEVTVLYRKIRNLNDPTQVQWISAKDMQEMRVWQHPDITHYVPEARTYDPQNKRWKETTLTSSFRKSLRIMHEDAIMQEVQLEYGDAGLARFVESVDSDGNQLLYVYPDVQGSVPYIYRVATPAEEAEIFAEREDAAQVGTEQQGSRSMEDFVSNEERNFLSSVLGDVTGISGNPKEARVLAEDRGFASEDEDLSDTMSQGSSKVSVADIGRQAMRDALLQKGLFTPADNSGAEPFSLFAYKLKADQVVDTGNTVRDRAITQNLGRDFQTASREDLAGERLMGLQELSQALDSIAWANEGERSDERGEEAHGSVMPGTDHLQWLKALNQAIKEVNTIRSAKRMPQLWTSVEATEAGADVNKLIDRLAKGAQLTEKQRAKLRAQKKPSQRLALAHQFIMQKALGYSDKAKALLEQIEDLKNLGSEDAREQANELFYAAIQRKFGLIDNGRSFQTVHPSEISMDRAIVDTIIDANLDQDAREALEASIEGQLAEMDRQERTEDFSEAHPLPYYQYRRAALEKMRDRVSGAATLGDLVEDTPGPQGGTMNRVDIQVLADMVLSPQTILEGTEGTFADALGFEWIVSRQGKEHDLYVKTSEAQFQPMDQLVGFRRVAKAKGKYTDLTMQVDTYRFDKLRSLPLEEQATEGMMTTEDSVADAGGLREQNVLGVKRTAQGMQVTIRDGSGRKVQMSLGQSDMVNEVERLDSHIVTGYRAVGDPGSGVRVADAPVLGAIRYPMARVKDPNTGNERPHNRKRLLFRTTPENMQQNELTEDVDLAGLQEETKLLLDQLPVGDQISVSFVKSLEDPLVPPRIRKRVYEEGGMVKPQKEAMGVYDGRHVYVFLNNHANAQGTLDTMQVFNTVMHEAVGHHGMKAVIHKEYDGELKDFLRDVDRLYGKEINSPHKKGSPQWQNDIEEFVARRFENAKWNPEKQAYLNTEVAGWFDRLANIVVKSLRKVAETLGLKKEIPMTRPEMRVLLSKAYGGVKMERHSGLPHYVPNQFKPGHGIPAMRDFQSYEENFADKLLRKMEDMFRPWRLYNKSIRKEGYTVTDDMNVEQKLRVHSGRSSARLERVKRDFVEKFAHEVGVRKLKHDDVAKFLWAHTALERNPKLQEAYNNSNVNCGMSTDAAKKVLQTFKEQGKTQDLEAVSQIIWDANDLFIENSVMYGFLTREDADKMREAYKRFVPMAPDEDFSQVNQKPVGLKGRVYTIQSARAHEDLGRDPAAWTLARLQNQIVNGEKNLVKQSVLTLGERVGGAEHYTSGRSMFTLYYPQAELDRIREEKGWDVTQLEQWMVRKNIHAIGKELTDQPFEELHTEAIPVQRDGQTFYVEIEHEGLRRSFLQQDVPRSNAIVRGISQISRWLVLMNTSFNPEFIYSNLFRDAGTAMGNVYNMRNKNMSPEKAAMQVGKEIPRALKGIYTYKFGKGQANEYTELFREYEESGGRIGLPFLGNVEQNLVKAAQAQAKSAEQGPLARVTKESFTGFVELVTDVNDVVENASRLVAFKMAKDAGQSSERAAKIARELTVDFNRKGEWGQLFNSLYLFANAGIGGSARILRGMARNPKRASKQVSAIVGGGLSLALLNTMAGGEDDDGVRFYDKISQDVKRSNLVVMIPGTEGNYIKIPMPYGFGFFYNLGHSLGEFGMGDEKGRHSPLDTAGEIMGALTHNFNPVSPTGGMTTAHGWLQFVAPTLADPIVDIGMEKTPFGSPLMPTPEYAGQPDAARHWDSVSPLSEEVTKWINDLTGGETVSGEAVDSGLVDISPETFDYMLNFVGGGAQRFYLDKVVGWSMSKVRGEDTNWNDVPGMRRIVGEPYDFYNRQLFNEATADVKGSVDRLEEIQKMAAYAHDEHNQQMAQETAEEFYNDNKKLIALDGMRKQMYSQLKDIESRKERVHKSGWTEKKKAQRLRELDDAGYKVMKRFNQEYIQKVR